MSGAGWCPGAAKRETGWSVSMSARTAGGILALACTKSNTLLWARMMNPMISRKASLLCCCPNPRSLHDWSGAELCPLLAAHQRSPAARGQRPRQRLDCPVWQGAGGRSSGPPGPAAGCPGLESSLYPAGEQAGIPLLLLGTNRFSPSWCRRSKPRSGTSTCVIWPPCPP
jgi:phosphoserine phosphatase